MLCILGMARSGSSYLCAVLANQPAIDGRFEIFNPKQIEYLRPEELRELSRRSGKTFPAVAEDPVAIQVVRESPTRTLECLMDMLQPEKRLLTFKVLRRQLRVRKVRKEIIARPDTAIAILRRRPIDAFISSRKARLLQRWEGVDTTNVKIDIEVGDFLKWWDATAEWYRDLEKACWRLGKPFHRLSYEDDVDVEPSLLVQRLRRLATACGINDLVGSVIGSPTIFARQDRTSDVEARVANWPAFHRSLADQSWKAFSPFPSFEPSWRDRRRRILRPLWRQLRRAVSGR